MAETSHPTRQVLLDAGLDLADDIGLGELSVNHVVRQAHLAKGTFYVHFADRTDYLVALHRGFHDQLRSLIRTAAAGLPAGGDRLRRSASAYLDGCLHARGVKAMLLHARGVQAIAQAVAQSDDRFAHAAAPDLAELGVAHPLEAARLFVAMVAQVALLECTDGRAEPDLRDALWEMAHLDHAAA